MGRIVGIDLGTTNSVVAVYERGRPVVIPNRLGEQLTPSAVQILPDHRTLVGTPALRARLIDPTHTITGIKRFMGRHYNEVVDLAEAVPFMVVPGADQRAVVKAHGREYTPEAISALILADLKASAEAYLNDRVEGVVITVPAHFNQSQRRATMHAAQLTGLAVKRVVVEPTAAALAHGLGAKTEKVILVFDLGGGTFDVSVVEEGDDVCLTIAVAGDTHLGGDDFDEVLVTWAIEEIRRAHAIDVSRDPRALQRVREAMVKAKCDLSFHASVIARIPFLSVSGSAPADVTLPVTRAHFEHLSDELFQRLEVSVRQVMTDAKMLPDRFDHVLLVGGASRMPRIAEMMRARFGPKPLFGMNMEEAVALGAAVQAAIISRDVTDLVLIDAVDYAIGVEADGGGVVMMISKGTTIPTQKKEVFSTMFDGQSSVEIHVVRGSGRSRDDESLLLLSLDGIAAAPAGVPRVEVTVDIDHRMEITVTAKDLASGRAERGWVT